MRWFAAFGCCKPGKPKYFLAMMPNERLHGYFCGNSLCLNQPPLHIEDGKLVIEAKREACEGNQFTSARLHTNGRMSFKYGTLEARIKLPRMDNGLWPAFWMLGTNFGLDGWPKSGEWDILEAGYKSAIDNETVNKSVSGAMHWRHETGTWSDWLQADSAASTTLPVNLYGDYHTYKLDWTPTKHGDDSGIE